jgi:hypothetical protein
LRERQFAATDLIIALSFLSQPQFPTTKDGFYDYAHAISDLTARIYFKEKICPACERILLQTELVCIECGTSTHILVGSDAFSIESWVPLQHADCFRLDEQIRHLLTGYYLQDVVHISFT